MMNQVQFPYSLVFVYDNGDQFVAGQYVSLKDVIQAKNQAKNELGKADITGRVLESISILKEDEE